MADLTTLLLANYPFLLVLLMAGAAAGLLAGLFGVGGGIVIVPALYGALMAYGYSAEVAMHVALGTSLASIILTGLSSARAHWKRGSVNQEVLRLLAPATAVGAGVGAFVASWVPGHWLTILFAVFAVFVAVLMAQGRKGFALVRQLPRQGGQHVLGGCIGFFSSMLGIGGGTISVPTLAACGYEMKVAVGTGATLGLAIAVPGALGFIAAGWGMGGLPPFSLGYVSLLAMAVITPLSTLMAPLGAKVAHKLPELWLRRGFALFLLLVAVKMVVNALP